MQDFFIIHYIYIAYPLVLYFLSFPVSSYMVSYIRFVWLLMYLCVFLPITLCHCWLFCTVFVNMNYSYVTGHTYKSKTPYLSMKGICQEKSSIKNTFTITCIIFPLFPVEETVVIPL